MKGKKVVEKKIKKLVKHYCDECGCKITQTQYKSGKGLCWCCIQKINLGEL